MSLAENNHNNILDVYGATEFIECFHVLNAM